MLALLLAAAVSAPTVDVRECSRESVLLALRATAGLPTGIPDVDPPRLSMHDTEETRGKALAARDARVKALAEMVLEACREQPHFKKPEPPKPAEPEAQR
jgi:hypothetical protein